MGPGDALRAGACGFGVRREVYFRELGAVEVQKTFARVPPVEKAERWRAEAPEGFAFCVKAWQGITHPATGPTYAMTRVAVPKDRPDRYGGFQMTGEVMEGYGRLVEFAEALEAEMLLFQTPRSFAPTDENVERAVAFLRMASRDLRVAWEPSGWTRDDLRRVNRRVRVVQAVDPFAGPSMTRGEVYFRLHGSPPGARMHYYNYTKRDLRRLLRAAAGRPGFVFFNNVTGYDDAIAFAAMMAGSEERPGSAEKWCEGPLE